jgi:hypothetical protein
MMRLGGLTRLEPGRVELPLGQQTAAILGVLAVTTVTATPG